MTTLYHSSLMRSVRIYWLLIKSTTINNRFFPLIPGTTFVYEGQTASNTSSSP